MCVRKKTVLFILSFMNMVGVSKSSINFVSTIIFLDYEDQEKDLFHDVPQEAK